MIRFKYGRFYGEGEGQGGSGAGSSGAAGAAGAGAGAGTPPAGENKPVTFTQDDVNKMMAEHKRGLQTQLTDAQKTIDELKKTGANTTELQKKVKELQDSLLTKEELARQEAETLKLTFEEQIKQTSEAASTWKGRYETSIFNQELTRAAGKHDAFDSDQLAVLLERSSQVVEATDKEGKPTGQFKVLTKVNIDGKELTLPIDEAVGKLRESGKYPNQFKVKGSPGTGITLNNNPGATDVASGEVPKDMNQFMKMWNTLPASVRGK